ncbi:Protein CBG25718 [Caenorhabditis briggsae]|uniref:Protein CBG25718 n=1 Tax=Caenorhabditis briggsae TaxID=6238 RepID=B6IGY1_CAEBR|nr:Protein CBG25718 [Caenorhabditis briggsae]CAR99161.1 Protein CBG25718 [Caenorhabditis briggsae]
MHDEFRFLLFIAINSREN